MSADSAQVARLDERVGTVLKRLDDIGQDVKTGFHEVNAHLRQLNGGVAENRTGIAVNSERLKSLEDFQDKTEPTIDAVKEGVHANKREIAVLLTKFGAIGAGGGAGISFVLWLLKELPVLSQIITCTATPGP